MKRKIVWVGTGYLCGLLVTSLFNISITTAMLFAAVGFAFAFVLKNYRSYIITTSICFAIGVVVYDCYNAKVYDKTIAFSGQSVTIEGFVADYTYLSSDTALLTVDGKIDGEYAGKISFYVDDFNVEYYDEISVTGYVSEITDSILYQSKDYQKSNGVFLHGKNAENISVSGKNSNPLMREILQFRDNVSQKLVAVGDYGRVLSAMLCGDKTQLTALEKAQLYHAGIGHIFSVSGTHLVIIIMLISVFIKPLPLSRRMKAAVVIVFIWLFAGFSGFTPSVCRAAVMMSLYQLAMVINRPHDNLTVLVWAGIILVTVNPFAIRSPSLILSMAGAFSLGVCAPLLIKKLKLKNKIIKSAVSMMLLTMITMPLSAVIFNGVSVISPLTNIILVPLCSIALMLTAVGIFLTPIAPLSTIVIVIASKLMGIVLTVCSGMYKLPYEYLNVSGSAINLIVAVSICSVIGVYAVKTRRQYAVICLSLYIFLIVTDGVCIVKSYKDVKCVVAICNESAVVVLYCGEKAVVLDLGLDSKTPKVVETISAVKGIKNIGSYSLSSRYTYMKPLCQTDVVSANVENCLDDAECYFNGWRLSESDGKIYIESDNIAVVIWDKMLYNNNTAIDISDGLPLEITLSENIEVRRLDYGFGNTLNTR